MTRVLSRRRRRGAEHGSATLLVLGCAVVVLAVGVVGSVLGAAIAVRHRAAAAADLAALAAAREAIFGPTAACTAAARIAGVNGGRLRSCTLAGSIATVEVSVAPRGVLARFPAPVGRARAGPAVEPSAAG